MTADGDNSVMTGITLVVVNVIECWRWKNKNKRNLNFINRERFPKLFL